MHTLLTSITLLGLLSSSYGLGLATMKWGIRDETSHFSLLAVIGVASLMVLGGILNLIGMAYPAAMYILLLLGLIFFMGSFVARFKTLSTLASLRISSHSPGNVSLLNDLLPLVLVAIAIIFFAANLLPSDVFNIGDDFHTYFHRPVRMLQTGTLAGDPYDLLGLDSLGAQAFLQGFIVLMLPIEYLAGFDAVFGLGLAGLLLIATVREFNLSWIYATPAILTFLVINPQSVNVSSLYSGAFAILGLLLASCLLAERLNEPGTRKSQGMAALVGLLISSLVALKTTFVFFAAIYFVLFGLGLFLIIQPKRHALLLTATAVLVATIAILPWLLLHLPNYAAALDAPSHPGTATAAYGFFLPKDNLGGLFSARDLFYGGSLLGYLVIIVMLATLGAFSVFVMLGSNRNQAKRRGCSLVGASACAAAIGTYILNGLMFDPDTAVRYACPVLIATLPFALLVSSLNVTSNLAQDEPTSPFWICHKTVILVGAVLVIALFGGNFVDRIERARDKHTTISYPISKRVIQYNHYVLSEESRQTLRNIQNRTAAGAKILAMISMPMHLDFSRNEILTVMEPGLTTPWLDWPLSDNAADVSRYLKEQGIRYIIWEYQGFGTTPPGEFERMLSSRFPIYRRLGERNLYMRKMLISIISGRNVLYNKDGVVLFDLSQINDPV